jgi:hydrogenase nickel incorporation protein HypA/HybF
MHELSIALSLIELAEEELRRHGGSSVDALHLRLGPLSGVVKEALLWAYELAREQSPPLAASRLLIEDVPVAVLCSACGGEREVESIQDMRCRACGTLCGQVVRGRELELFAMEICDEPLAAIG